MDDEEVAAEEPSGGKMDDDDGGGGGVVEKDGGAAILAFGRQTRLGVEVSWSSASPPPLSPPPPGESTPVAGEREDSATRHVGAPSLDKPSLASISLADKEDPAADADAGGGGAGDIRGTLKEEPSRARIDFRHFARRF